MHPVEASSRSRAGTWHLSANQEQPHRPTRSGSSTVVDIIIFILFLQNNNGRLRRGCGGRQLEFRLLFLGAAALLVLIGQASVLSQLGPLVPSLMLHFHHEPGYAWVGVCESPPLLTRKTLESSPVLAASIARALRKHGVVVFSGQTDLTPHDEVHLMRCLEHDPTEEHPSESARLFGQSKGDNAVKPSVGEDIQGGEPWLEDCPAVRLVGRATVQEYFGTTATVKDLPDWAPDQRAWHQDGTADTTYSPRFGMLHAIKAPSGGGGETLFVCSRAIARDLLQREEVGAFGAADPPPSALRARYRRHAKSKLARDGVAIESAEGAMTQSNGPFPLIARDAQGPLLVYNWNLECFEGMTPSASWQCARRLLAPALNDETKVYEHRWTSGELLIWDNWATLHTATAPCRYGDQERLMHRVRLRSPSAPIPWRPSLRERLEDEKTQRRAFFVCIAIVACGAAVAFGGLRRR